MNAGDDRALLDEDELRAALRPHRPDPDAFARGVRERMERIEREGADPASRPLPRWMQAAAGLLPPAWTRDPAFETAAAGLGWKGLALAVAALPAALLVAIGVAFVAGLRALRVLRADNLADVEDVYEVPPPWRPGRYFLLLLILVASALPLVFAFVTFDVLLFLVLCSMAALVAWIRRLDRLGLAGRSQVASGCAALLWIVFAITLFSNDLTSAHPWIPVILLAGLAICAVFARRRFARVGRGGIAVLGFAALLLTSLVLTSVVRPLLPGDEDVREFIERFDGGSNSDWEAWQYVLQCARDRGHFDFDLSRPTAGLRQLAGEGPLNPYVLSAAARAGLLEIAPDLIEPLTASTSAHFLTTDTGRISHIRQNAGYVLALEAAGRLDSALRGRMQDRLAATIVDERFPPELDDLETTVHLLDRIAGPHAANALRGEIQALLRASYREERKAAGPRAGFAKYGLGHIHDEATISGLELLLRFGVPDGIDVHRIRRTLVEEARPLVFIPRREDPYAAAEALRRLDARWPPEFHPLDWRLEIAAALFAVLCVLASVRAPLAPAAE